MLNILEESFIRVRTSAGERRASLPEALALLMRDEVEAFPALRPHQRHAWHAFLVQLGAMALQRAGVSEPPTDAPKWQALIRGLTPDFPADEPWRLVVDDITKPAFMQPPSTDWTKYDKKEVFPTPDALDMLDTAKNHDLKTSVATESSSEDWMYALITMQTMNGQVGRGNYPIARMNSGDGSRTAFSVTPSIRPGAHIRRDMLALLEQPSELIGELPFHWDGLGLLWTERWDDEKEVLPLQGLHPFFIEICRLRRICVDADERLYAKQVRGAGRRINATQNRGVVGDPWTLVTKDKQGLKALTMQRYSFGYRRLSEYLTSPDWHLPYLSKSFSVDPAQGDAQLVARAIRRKKGGQTERYYERIIPINNKTKTAIFGRGSELKKLGRIADDRIKQAAIVQGFLKESIETFIAQGDIPRLRKMNKNKRLQVRESAEKWSDKLDAIIDRTFFEDLQVEFEEEDADERDRIRNKWLLNDKDDDGVINHARHILANAQDALPCLTLQRYRARVRSDSVFKEGIEGPKGLPFLYNTKNDDKKDGNECQNSEQTQQTQRRLL